MQIKTIEFTGSFEHLSQCPAGSMPEYAFIGRSNVGKSSLINALANRKEIARISSTPGKTQTLNYFLVNASWYLVDLPGYGYAVISKKKRQKWKAMTEEYLLNRKNLACIFVLLDSRHSLQENDRAFINWVGEHGIPFAIVYTKADKPRKSELKKNIGKIQQGLLEDWEELPPQFVSSAETGEGIEAILNFIDEINNK